jgi:DNA-binding NarL/FixJ family response regulator
MTANVAALTVFAPHDGPARRLRLVQDSARAADTIRVAVADGQRLVRAGVRLLLERDPGIAVVGEAATGEEAIALARRTRPDVMLIDVHVPGLDCVEATRRMLAEPGVAVMLLTASETDQRLFAALGAGADGLLLKDTEPVELVRAVKLLGRGGRLRPRSRHRKRPSREEERMLTPKVVEIRRGCAHGPTVRPANAAAGPQQRP